MNRRTLILSSLAIPLAATTAWATPLRMAVHRSPTCGCCGAWAQHIEDAGINITMIEMEQADLWELKLARGIPQSVAACHTAELEGYIVEGHVPVADVLRLVDARPDAIGLAVPGMPAGSPGMEMNGRRDAFDTMLIARDGSTSVFQSHT